MELITNFHDDLISSQIISAFKQVFSKVNPNTSCIEVGAGKRLSLLASIHKLIGLDAYAIDPIYSNKDSFQNIKLLNSIDQLETQTKQNIVIARNCLEYLRPEEIKILLNKILADESLICFELQSLNEKKWGNTFYFREYYCFYSKLSIEKIIKQSGWNIKWISSLELNGDERTTYIGYVTKTNFNQKLTYFESIHALIRALKEEKSKKKIYLWGAGGRGLSFLYNDGKLMIDKVIDSSIDRQGIPLGQYGNVISPNEIVSNSIIVLLNSRYLYLIPNQIKNKNQIFLLS